MLSMERLYHLAVHLFLHNFHSTNHHVQEQEIYVILSAIYLVVVSLTLPTFPMLSCYDTAEKYSRVSDTETHDKQHDNLDLEDWNYIKISYLFIH